MNTYAIFGPITDSNPASNTSWLVSDGDTLSKACSTRLTRRGCEETIRGLDLPDGLYVIIENDNTLIFWDYESTLS